MGQLSNRERSEALHFALNTAAEAYGVARRYRRGVASTTKIDGTPVTQADIEIEEMVRGAVAGERPGESVLGEEQGRGVAGSNRVWVVDPIDGTEVFAAGEPGAVFSIALVVDGRPEVAVVHDLHDSRVWCAMEGNGAYSYAPRTKLRTSVLTAAQIQYARPANSGDHLWAEVVSRVYGNGVRMMERGSVIAACMEVADGRLEAVIYGRSSPWDMAAASLIVTEAGGAFSDLNGLAQRLDLPLNGGIVSNGACHSNLVKMIAGQAP